MSSSTGENSLPRLGSLAQSAREKELKRARGLLLLVGILTIGFNGFLLYNARAEAHDVVAQELQKQGPFQQPNPAAVQAAEDQIWTFCVAIYGGLVALGVLFVVLGLAIKRFPVPITVISLVLYILANAGLAVLNPLLLVQGIIFKIIFVIALIKAVQSAIAYERERATPLEIVPDHE